MAVDARIGAVLGDYAIEGPLGEGGAGTVYRARDTVHDRAVALKVLRGGSDRRFAREIAIVSELRHPHVLPVYAAGEADGVRWVAMRLVDGPSLARRLDAGALAPREAVRIVAAVASALEAAHAAGFVHRDVKPGNVLLEGDDVWLSDFGIARRVAPDVRETADGAWVGTPLYIAPEQLAGAAAGPPADVYALTGVLHHALTGQPPYASEELAALLMAHVSRPPPRPSDVAAALAPFDAVVAAGMAKDPGRRPTAGALRALAEEALARLAPEVAAVAAVEAAPSGWRPTAGAAAAPAAAWATPAPVPMPVAEPWPPQPPAPVADTWVPPASAAAPGTSPPPPPAPARVADTWPPPAPAPVADTWPPPAPEAWPPPAHAPPPPSTTITGPAVPAPPAPAPPAVAAWPPPATAIPLQTAFRYVHEPLVGDHGCIPFLGDQDTVDALKDRVRHSEGGAFLVTGFRGVGKSTVVRRALSELRDEGDVVDVHVTVARPVGAGELLFEVVRRLFERLVDTGVYARLDEDVRAELLRAYLRTSLSMEDTRSRSVETSGQLGIGASGRGLLGLLAPSLQLSRRKTQQLASRATFLAYSTTDVEHDFLRIVELLRRGADALPAGRSRRRGGWRGRVVVVLDELDKLTAADGGTACVEGLLSSLKNLLTAGGAHFVFIAGPELHDLAMRESRRGNSVYESVFGWKLYVPCTWSATRQLLDAVLDGPHEGAGDDLVAYLDYRARGVPRLLLHELNALVRWDEDGPALRLGDVDRARVGFYARLERTLEAFVGEPGAAGPFVPPVDEDRRRLSAYYVTDWILAGGARSFTAADVCAEDAGVLDPLLRPDPERVAALLEHLVARGVLERARESSTAQRLLIGDVPEAQEDAYRLTARVQARLAGLAAVSEDERGGLAAVDAAETVDAGRYTLEAEVSRGATGRVYRARDRVLGATVAIKLLDVPGLKDDATMRARFSREATLAADLRHPGLVRVHGGFEEPDGRLGLVMDWVEGPSLRRVLSGGARLAAPDAVAIALDVLDALCHLETRGIARLDLKPSSIMLPAPRRPVVVDLGVAKRVDDDDERTPDVTATGTLLGTPAYAAPEQLRGERVDIRADLHALALILWEALAGRPARGDGPAWQILRAVFERSVDPAPTGASPALQQVLARALALAPEDRYAGSAEMAAALAATPEAALLR